MRGMIQMKHNSKAKSFKIINKKKKRKRKKFEKIFCRRQLIQNLSLIR